MMCGHSNSTGTGQDPCPRSRGCRSRGRLAPFLAAVTLLVPALLALGGLVGPAAWASAGLVSSDPADGAILSARPQSVTLVFDASLRPDSARVRAASASSGAQVELEEPVVEGRQVVLAWPDNAPTGSYRVQYRVRTASGALVTGRIGFRYGRSGLSAASAQPGDPAQASASAPGAAGQAVGSVEALGPSPQKAPMTPVMLLAVTGVGVLVLVGALGGVFSSRPRRAHR